MPFPTCAESSEVTASPQARLDGGRLAFVLILLIMPTLDFKGKQHIYAHHLTVPYRPLVPDAEKSLTPPPP